MTLTSYRVGPGTTVNEAWSEIKRLRELVVDLDPPMVQSFKEELLFSILLASLPAEYEAVRDMLDISVFNLKTKPNWLREKQSKLKQESGHVARDRRPNLNRKRSLYREFDKSSRNQTYTLCKGTIT